jgi:putative iron-dependent peroxidase
VTVDAAGAADTEPQAVCSPLTGAAIFLVVTVRPGADNADTARGLCGDLAGLVRAVGFRGTEDYLTCVTGLSAALWDRLTSRSRPAGLHPFEEIRSGPRVAVATPGDLLFHIRSARMDLCFELASQIMDRLRGAVTVADEVHGFRYFEHRDLLGFVDGTENPEGPAAERATLIGAEDTGYAGGSYVIAQKYLHDLDAWNALPVEQQENVIGRKKLSDIELDDTVKPDYAHNALTSITDADGEEIQILRDNMPFGRVGDGEFGTYFIGYARSPDPIELMLRNMFIGRPEGTYDRILDVSRAVTGGLFFVPPAAMLEGLADDDTDNETGDGETGHGETGHGETGETGETGEAAAASPAASPAPPAPSAPPASSANGRSTNGSLNIGSLRGVSHDE